MKGAVVATRLEDGRIKLVLPPKDEFRVGMLYQSVFYSLSGFLAEALSGLGRKQHEFPARVGISYEQADSLWDELFLISYDVLGQPRHRNPHTGELLGTKEVRRTGTAWDRMPKIEAELLPDGRLSLVLGRDELTVFANCVDVALEELAPRRSEVNYSEWMTRTSTEPEEAEAFRDELRRLDREVREESG